MDLPQRDRRLQAQFIERGYDDPVPPEAVPERSLRGEWYFRRLDLTERQFSGLNFRNADFSYCRAPRSNWASAYLADSRFCGADLVGADWRGSYLRGADLRSLDLRGADLRGADLSQTDLRGTSFCGADIAGVCWHQSRGDHTTQLPAGLTLEALGIQAVHPYAQWSGLNLQRTDLRHLNLSHANLTDALLLRADLRGTHLGHASLEGAHLTGCVYGPDTQFPQDFDPIEAGCLALGDHANLSGADLSGLDLSHLNLSAANLSNANLRRSLLVKTNFYQANLSRADLTAAFALGCDLTRANLDQATLDGLDLRAAQLPSGERYGAARSPFDARFLANALSIGRPNLR